MSDDDEPRRPPRRPPPRSEGVRDRLLDDAFRTEVRERLDALEHGRPTDDGGGGDLADEVSQLRRVVMSLVAANEGAPPPFHWDDLSPVMRDQRWGELETWLADVLTVHHPREAAAIPACWLAWVGAYRAPTRRHSDPADWVARHLPAMTRQLATEIGSYCETHASDDEEGPDDDRS